MARGYPGQKNPFGPIYMIGGLLTVRHRCLNACTCLAPPPPPR
jgi:hypothetical protein